MPQPCRAWTENRRRLKARRRLQADKLRADLLRKYPDLPQNQLARPSREWVGNSQGVRAFRRWLASLEALVKSALD